MDGLEIRSVFPCTDLEYRQKGRRLTGSFPYGLENTATISDRGRVRKEAFASRAFGFAVKSPEHRIDLLIGHDFSAPLASKHAKSLKLTDSARSLDFEAVLPPERKQPSYMRDAVLQLGAGLLGGISPGFRIPPKNRVANAEEQVQEKGNPGVFIRVIRAAVLFELSLVARPAYLATRLLLRQEDRIITPKSNDRYRVWL